MPVVGEGTFGCVHKPSLECKEPNIDYTNKVSKIMTSDSANDELKEFKLLNKIDKENEHFLGTPIKCNLKHTAKNLIDISKCRNSNKYHPNTSKELIKLLIMEDGGVNCEQYLYSLRNSASDAETKKNNLALFYMHFYNIFKSIEFFNKKKVAHRDIKLQNIVYNDKTEVMKMIDFGLLSSYKNAKHESRENKYWLNYFFWSIPPFALFANKSRYENIKKYLGRPISHNYKERLTNYTKSVINELDNNSSMNNHFYGTLTRRNNFKILKLKKSFHKSFENMISKIHLYSHREYLKKMFYALDVYNLGHTLLHSFTIIEPDFHINKTYFFKVNFIKKMVELGLDMLSFDVFDHISISESIERYKTILQEHINVNDHNYEFKNDKIVPKKTQDVKNLDVSIITPFDFIKDDKKCPPEKDLNPNTNRCVKKCKDDFIRDDNFKCVKNKTMKNQRTSL